MTDIQHRRSKKLSAVAWIATVALFGCGPGDATKAPVPPDEYDLVQEENDAALEKLDAA